MYIISTVDKMNTLIEKIKTAQRQKNLTDGGLSRVLCIDRSTWSYIKSGKRNPGAKFLCAVAQQLPELHFDVLQYMRNNGNRGNK
jgi:transcriptional regulator with XRE-family HTH domain